MNYEAVLPVYTPFVGVAEEELTRLIREQTLRLTPEWECTKIIVRPFERLFFPVWGMAHPDKAMKFVRRMVFFYINQRQVAKIGVEGYLSDDEEFLFRPGKSYVRSLPLSPSDKWLNKGELVTNQQTPYRRLILSPEVVTEFHATLGSPHRFYRLDQLGSPPRH